VASDPNFAVLAGDRWESCFPGDRNLGGWLEDPGMESSRRGLFIAYMIPNGVDVLRAVKLAARLKTRSAGSSADRSSSKGNIAGGNKNNATAKLAFMLALLLSTRVCSSLVAPSIGRTV